MRNLATILSFIILINTSCSNPRSGEEFSINQAEIKENDVHPIKSEILIAKLDEMINYRDSLAEFLRINTNSYWIYFIQKGNECFVTILAHSLNAYVREEMDGFFIHRERFVTLYNSNSICGTDFINSELLQKGRISGLLDLYEKDDYNVAFPPHNNYGREYLIIHKENIVLVSQGTHLGRIFPEDRIPIKP